MLGRGNADCFFPLGRIAPQLLEPDIRLAGATRNGLLLLLNCAGTAFETNQIVLKLKPVAVECRSLGLQFVIVGA